jgi:hypothetical protein
MMWISLREVHGADEHTSLRSLEFSLREARSGETECQYLSSRQYSALNKDFQIDDVFVDPKLSVSNQLVVFCPRAVCNNFPPNLLTNKRNNDIGSCGSSRVWLNLASLGKIKVKRVHPHSFSSTSSDYREQNFHCCRHCKFYSWVNDLMRLTGVRIRLPWLGNRIFIVNDSILNNAPSTWSVPK